jgi:hypothetical protein
MEPAEENEDVEMTRVRAMACEEYVNKSIQSVEELLQALKIIREKLKELETNPDRKPLVYEIKNQIAIVEIHNIQLNIYLKHFFNVFRLVEAGV